MWAGLAKNFNCKASPSIIKQVAENQKILNSRVLEAKIEHLLATREKIGKTILLA
jgi:hypothetical protein